MTYETTLENIEATKYVVETEGFRSDGRTYYKKPSVIITKLEGRVITTEIDTGRGSPFDTTAFYVDGKEYKPNQYYDTLSDAIAYAEKEVKNDIDYFQKRISLLKDFDFTILQHVKEQA